MTWQIFIILSILSEAFGRLVQRIILKDDKSDPIAYAVVFQLLGAILIGTFTFYNGFKIPNLVPILLNVVFTPILWGGTNILIFKALKKTEASIFSILFATRAIWIIIAAVLFLGESFTTRQIFGTLLILTSVGLVSRKKETLHFDKGSILAILSSIALALAVVNDSFIIQSFDASTYLTYAYIAPGLLIWIVYPRSTGKIVAIFKNKILLKVGLLAFLYGSASLLYLYGYQLGNNAAQIASLFQISTLITVFLAIIILNERSHMLAKFSAAIFSFVGVLLVK